MRPRLIVQFATLMILANTVIAFGQNLLPPVYNYGLLEYKGGSKNWGLAVNDNGELFVANNQGLLHYNGEDWSLNKLPNNTTIRSVAAVGDLVFTGSYEEFGYWKKDPFGKLQYTSLTHLIKEYSFTSEEFWEILHFDGTIMFRSFSSIYIYKDGHINVVDPPQIISDIIVFNDKIVVACGDSGLFELENGRLNSFENQELLANKTVTDMVELDNGLLVGTKLNGCYFFDGETIKPWGANVNEELMMHQLNKILRLSDDKIAFGTIKNGVYIFDTNTETQQVFNRAAGLQNNTVLSMLKYQSNLWLGLDNGIARVKLDNPITYYTDFTGTLGTVYDIAAYNEKIYLGSNTGVFYFEDDELNFVNGSQGHVWDLEVLEGDLLCGHNTGTFKLNGNSLTTISPVSGGYEIIKIPEQTNTYVQGTYNGLTKFEKLENTWDVTPIRGMIDPIKKLCFETPRILWGAHPYKGLFRMHLDENNTSIDSVQTFTHDGAPSEYNVKIYNIKNQMVFYSEGKWYRYDPMADGIKEFAEFNKYEGRELLFFDEKDFWFIDSEENKQITQTTFKGDSLLITDLPLRRRLVPDSQRIVKMNDSSLYITLGDGFAKINPAKLRKQSSALPLPIPDLTTLIDENNIYPIEGTDVEIPYKDSHSITVGVAAPKLVPSRFYYELQGPKEYSRYIEKGVIDFENLPYGQYELNVFTVGLDNELSLPKKVRFEILPPWYLSNLSMLFYVIVGAFTILLVRRYNRRKLNRKQYELEEKLKKEQKERLAQLEKEKLAKEVKLKQNELASTTLNIAKKNEMILELKNLLMMNKSKFGNSQRYRSFMKRLNNSVKDTEDWKRFEMNFKELHEDFFERLLQEYPKLTPKDLKLCAYLKMNLSTKEIAPLMAISVRGVEIHRYRLRKKLKMDSSENLSNFLITF